MANTVKDLHIMTWEESNTTYSSYNWMLITILFVRFSLTNLVFYIDNSKQLFVSNEVSWLAYEWSLWRKEPTTTTWATLTSVVSICYQEWHIHGVTKRVHHCSYGLLFSLIGSVIGCNANFTSLLSNKLNPQRSTINCNGYLLAKLY